MRPIVIALCLWSAAAGLPLGAQDGGKAAPFDMFNDIEPAALKVDVPALIHVRTEKSVARVRQELIAFIWKNGGQLPTATDVVRAEVDLPKPLVACAATCATLTIDLTHGFKSLIHHLHPRRSNGKLVIIHQGHADVWTGGIVETTKFFLDKGYSALVCQMPLMGDNRRLAPPTIGSHNDMAKLATPELEPIKFFVEPIVVALNHCRQRYAFEDVVMIGLSGGGWTTTLYAAIDPRVRLSFPVAGTLPEYLRTGHHAGRDRGDWEQYYPALYKVANYLDLYVLGASGPGRRQRQVLNKFDSCCFAGVRYRTYEKHVRQAVADIGGAFDVQLDESHRSHLISHHALDKAIGPLLDEPRRD